MAEKKSVTFADWLMETSDDVNEADEIVSSLPHEMQFNGAAVRSESEWYEAVRDYYMRLYMGMSVKIERCPDFDGECGPGEKAVLFVRGAAQLILVIGYWPPEEVDKLFRGCAGGGYYDIPCFYKIGEFASRRRENTPSGGADMTDESVFLDALPSNEEGKRIYAMYLS